MGRISYAFQIPDSRPSERQRLSHLLQRVNNTMAANFRLGAMWQLARNLKAAPDWHKTKSNGAPFIFPKEEAPRGRPACHPPVHPPGLLEAAAELSTFSLHPYLTPFCFKYPHPTPPACFLTCTSSFPPLIPSHKGQVLASKASLLGF